MKIGILSFPNAYSHGASLQMYALYTVIKDLGSSPEIINYCSANGILLSAKGKSLRSVISNLLNRLFIKSSDESFARFERRMIKFPANVVSSDKEVGLLAERYDRIIVGSDQVWNPDITGSTKSFYLDFLKDSNKKASYAPSFGYSNVPKEMESEISELLRDIKYLSVREQQGADIIKALIGKDVPVVLDPTFLIESDEWKKLAVYPKHNYGKYALYYTVKPSLKLYTIAQEFAAKQGIKLVVIGGGLRDKINLHKSVEYGVGPEEFLGLVDKAEYVITNSFHGMAFSIIMKKNFYIEFSSKTNSRLENIVNIFGLQECVVHDSLIEKDPIKINYNGMDTIMQSKKNESLMFLRSIIEENNE